jgi:vacuolar-type H+-ATPase subunit F/Vma7
MNFQCIGDEDTVRGFRLAGVGGQVVVNPEQTAVALQRVVEAGDCGILFLGAAVAAGIRPQVDAIRFGGGTPLIVEIPGPGETTPSRKSLRQIVQEATGMDFGQEETG